MPPTADDVFAPISQSDWSPEDGMQRSIAQWIRQMPSDMEVMFLESMQRIAVASPITRWSLCAGCGIGSRFYTALSAVLKGMYALSIDFGAVLYSELHPDKAEFLTVQHDVPLLVSNMDHLKGFDATDHRDGNTRILPNAIGFDAGFPCVSRTPQSCNRARNINCVQEARERTGEGWAMVHAALKAHCPQFAVFENVKELGHKVADDRASDAEYICEQLAADGFWAWSDVLEAEDFGSYGPRTRMYWCAIRAREGCLGVIGGGGAGGRIGKQAKWMGGRVG